MRTYCYLNFGAGGETPEIPGASNRDMDASL